MIDKTSFSGYQNIGSFINQFGTNDRRVSRIIIELNDNGLFKDLSNFKEVFRRYPDAMSNNTILKLEITDDIDNIKNSNEQIQLLSKLLLNKIDGNIFYLNGKPLSHEKDISIFQKIFNLLEHISKSEEEIYIDENYIKSIKAKENFLDNTDPIVVKNLSRYETSIFYHGAKRNIKTFLNGIQNSMNNFFRLNA